MEESILLIYTGGTIGMVLNEDLGLLEPFNFDNLLKQIPQLQKFDAHINTISVEVPKDSATMRFKDWVELGQLIFDNYYSYSGFVVLHGTDTMAYTTSALSFMFSNLRKPIIFTGSQLPIGEVRTDAIENVLTSIELALLKEKGRPLINEVCLYFGNQLFRGNCVTKISSENFNAFVSPHCPVLATSNIKLEVNKSLLMSNKGSLLFSSELGSSVFVYKIHPAISKDQFEKVCEFVKFKVLIIESYGAGTVFLENWFVKNLEMLISKGIFVINVSQCVFGKVDFLYESSKVLLDSGLISSGSMTLEAVITKSMHLLAKNLKSKEFKTQFLTNTAKELC